MFLLFELEISSFNISLEISSCYFSSWKFSVFIFLLAGDFQCLYFRYFQFLFFRYFQCQAFACFSNWKFLLSRCHLRFPVSIFRTGDFQFFFRTGDFQFLFLDNWRFPIFFFLIVEISIFFSKFFEAACGRQDAGGFRQIKWIRNL